MKVHLVGSLRGSQDDITYLRLITQVIHGSGSVVALEWLEPAIIRLTEKVHISSWRPFVQSNLEALKASDVVIIDATHYSFSHGYHMAAALEYKKPVLVLSRNRLKYKYLTGFTDPLFLYKTYKTSAELERTVSVFLKKNTIHTKDLRFNLLLPRKIANYLEEQAMHTNNTKSDIIRRIIKKHILNKSTLK